MSVRSKIVLVLLGVVTLYTAVDNGLLRLTSSRTYRQWELDEGEQRAAEVATRIEGHVAQLEGKARIWASLEGVRELVAGEDAEIERDLDAADTDVDVFYVCDATGRVLWSRVVDPSTGEVIALGREMPAGALSPTHPLLVFRPDQEIVSGLMMTQRSPLLVCSYPIPDEDGVALLEDGAFRRPSRGVVILGTFVGPELRDSIGRAEKVAIQISSPADMDLSEEESALVDRITGEGLEVASLVGEDGLLHLFRAFEDLRTRYPLLLKVSLDREITARGKRAANVALLSTLATALLILFVLLRLLQRIVIRPLSTLTDKAIQIGRTDDTTIRTEIDRDDEIGQLSSEFDDMLEKLARSRSQVVKTARIAGMSEIATGVLHNVGNVLNSVCVAASLVKKEAKELATDDLEKVTGVLNEHQEDLGRFVSEDARGKHLVPFLGAITQRLGEQKARILSEMNTLDEGIEHVVDLVRAQQSHAGAEGVLEVTKLPDEVEAALRICSQVLDWQPDVQVVRDYEDLPALKVDRHKLVEVLVNLIQNAGQSLRDSGREDKRIELRVRGTGAGHVCVQVTDNGVGIPKENLARIFAHGFTTKADGHGFGLHISANAATEMNGALRVTSEGKGQGATFVLELPLNAEELRPAA